jgi:L-asparaginase
VGTNRIVMFTLGGTIAMAGDTGPSGGVVARLGGHDLIGDLASGTGIEVEVRDVQAIPSAALSFSDVLDVVDAARRAVADGAVGVVLTQGTDTLEETAFLIDLAWPDDAPFVVTGAMRNPTLAGADGPANLLASVEVAAAPAARGRGALVVFNDEIHAARLVRKAHSSSTATFESPDLGAIGQVVEGAPRFLAEVPRSGVAREVASRERLAATRVGLYTVTLDDDGLMLRSVADAYQGLVIAGFGVGHVPPALVPLLGDLAATIPVVLTSRTGAGSVFARTYGAVGSERDLRERGLISGGFLHPVKARVLLRLLVAAGAGREEIVEAFARLG